MTTTNFRKGFLARITTTDNYGTVQSYKNDAGWYNWRSGVGVPYYNKRIANMEDATSPFSGYRADCVMNGEVDWRLTVKERTFLKRVQYPTTVGDIGGYVGFNASHLTNPSTGLDTEARNMALRIFLNKARSAQTKMSGAVFLGELREAVHMIHGRGLALFTGLGDFLSALKKGKRRPRHQRRQYLESTYLEYAFGWAPLYHDIMDAVKAYHELGKRRRNEYIHAVGIANSGTAGTPSLRTLNSVAYFLQTNERNTTTHTIRGVLKCIPKGMEMQAAATLFGLQPREFLPTAWELLPWSFLIDYFTNIGIIIQAAVFDTSSMAWSCGTTRRVRNTTSMATPSYLETYKLLNPSFEILDFDAGPASVITTVTTVNRGAVGSYIPSLEVRFPGLSTQWINMAALLRQSARLRPYY